MLCFLEEPTDSTASARRASNAEATTLCTRTSGAGHEHDTIRGFTLIEIIVVLALLTLVAGTAIPVISRGLMRAQIKDTSAELAALAPAVATYFEDVGSFPPSFDDLESNVARKKGWNGPYLTAGISLRQREKTSLSADAWNQDYLVTVTGDSALEVRSIGPDAKRSTDDDLVQMIDVTPIRRAQTVEELDILNMAVRAYNETYLPASLPTRWKNALKTLVSKGYLPSGTSRFDVDGWGDVYLPDPAGSSPVVAVTSRHL